MRVRLKKAIAGTAGTFEAGMIADLPEAMAMALVAEGCAELVAVPAAVVETAAVAAPETAAILYASPRRRRK